MNSFIRTNDHLTMVLENGNTATVYTSNPIYPEVVAAIQEKDWDLAYRLSVPAVQMKERLASVSTSSHVVELVGGVVTLDGQPLHNTLTERMLQMVDDGFDIRPMANFLENLMENPSYRAVNELYEFMEHSDLPITEDGHFIAYKRVRDDYMDIYTGKMDNSVGATPSMPRNEVDDDRDRTCSNGLHFCSRGYLSVYGTSTGNRTMIVKINPRDVVSIPSDYNNAKGRCCLYEVIGELEHGNEEPLEGSYRELNPVEFEESVGEGVEEFELGDSVQSHSYLDKSKPEMIEQYDLNSSVVRAVYTTVKEAHEKTGVDPSSINKVCRGDRKSAGGFGWRKTQARAADDAMLSQFLDGITTVLAGRPGGYLDPGVPKNDVDSWLPEDDLDNDDWM